jgi:hypothetical protein
MVSRRVGGFQCRSQYVSDDSDECKDVVPGVLKE